MSFPTSQMLNLVILHLVRHLAWKLMLLHELKHTFFLSPSQQATGVYPIARASAPSAGKAIRSLKAYCWQAPHARSQHNDVLIVGFVLVIFQFIWHYPLGGIDHI